MASDGRQQLAASAGNPGVDTFDLTKTISTACRLICFAVGCLLLLIALYYALEVYGLVASFARDPGELKPRVAALAEVIGADKLAWQPPDFEVGPLAVPGAEGAPPVNVAAKRGGPLEFGRPLAVALYFVLLIILVRIPIALIHAGTWVMTRSFVADPSVGSRR